MRQSDSTSIFQSAIRHSLLHLNDDGELEKLRAAAGSLAGRYAKDRSLLIEAVHAVQDPAASASTPAFEKAADAVEAEWPTFPRKNSKGAVTLLRLTTISAIETAIIGDEELSALVWSAGAASMKRYESHDLTATWREVVERAGVRTVEAAHNAWALTSASVEIDTIPNAKSVEPVVPDRPAVSYLESEVAAAVASKDAEGNALPNGNRYAPGSQHQPWADHLTEVLSAALDSYGNRLQLLNGKANKEMAESIQAAMNSLTSAVRTATRNALKGVIEAQDHLDRRSRLLWWSRTLHSTTLDVSYRALPPEVLPFVVALDAQGLVGPFAPLSVESLIREVIRVTECERASVPDLGDALAEAPETVSMMATPYAASLEGRLPVVRYLAARAAGTLADAWVDASANDRGEDAGDLAVWIYRSAQAHRLAFDA